MPRIAYCAKALSWALLAEAIVFVPARLQANNSTAVVDQTNELSQAGPKGDPDAGRVLFEQRCGVCHGLNGGGGRCPNLRRPVLEHASNIVEIAAVIKQGIAPDMPEGWYLSDQDLANLATYVYGLGQTPQAPLPGDPARGASLFEQSGCPACHILDGSGNGYGPDLSNIGAARGAGALRQTLINPRSSVPPDFLLVEVVAASGETIRGIRRNEDTLTIQIQDASGRFYSLVKSQLRSLKRLRGETPMPTFAGVLSQEQIDDLVAFLALRRRVP